VLPKHFWFGDHLAIMMLFAEHYVKLIFMPAFRLGAISVEWCHIMVCTSQMMMMMMMMMMMTYQSHEINKK
jgi:hypothetical protein